MNPISRILAAVLAALTLVGAFFFGLVVVLVLAVLMAILGAVIWMRTRWLARRGDRLPARDSRDQSLGKVIEAEYTVVSRRRD